MPVGAVYLAPDSKVVFNIIGQEEHVTDVIRNFAFCQTQGVEEYYLYDPFRQDFNAWVRLAGGFEWKAVENISGYTSPRLGVRFVIEDDGSLKICQPTGKRLSKLAEQRADAAEHRIERLAAKLRALGIDPETV